MKTPCELISQQVSTLFTCEPLGPYVRIQTPFLYPDGDVIDVYCQQEGSTTVLTDLGESQRWLKMQTTAQRKSLKQRQLITDICLTHNIKFERGMFTIEVKSPEDLASALMNLTQGILRVSDIWFTFRNRAGGSIIDDVDDLLQERSIMVERSPQVQGRSSKVWQPDLRTTREDRKTLIRVLSTGSRAAVSDLVNSTVAMWDDLDVLKAHGGISRFISLFDDTLAVDVWKLEDIRQIEKHSDVAYWSRSDQFLDKIA